jgi:hypothetical protein
LSKLQSKLKLGPSHVTPLECIGKLSFFRHVIILDYTLTSEVSC